PYVTTFIGFKAGMTLETEKQRGAARLTASMLTEGTQERTSKEIADESAFIGGGLHAHTGYDFTIIDGSALSNYTDRLFELVSDVLLNPSFPEDELKLKKANWLQELIMQRSKPSFLLEERFRKVIFGEHPYSIVAPHPDLVSSVTRDNLVNFHQNHYIPNDAILVVLGDFDKTEIKKTIETKLGAWKKGKRAIADLPTVPGHKGRKIYLVNRPGSVQTSLKIGNLGINKTDPDYFDILVMNEILGGAAHSRLFVNIREDKGYTYGAYSHASAKVHPDAFSASADVRSEVTAPSLQEFFYELERMRNLKVSEEELKIAKNYLAGQFQLRLETQSGLAERFLETSLYDLQEDYLANYTKKLMAVTIDDVRLAARRIIHAKDLVIAVVGDAKKIRTDLEMFAPVEVYSSEGDLVGNGDEKVVGDG
ncbi:MAG: insulinase family protein, partial [Candidatus Obscuribacterales bacterium]|nr:insulinase family protein [Candidatus Obscuribacterales bacterium]